MNNPETELRALWTEKGTPAERQDEILAEIAAAARPGARGWLDRDGNLKPGINL